MSTILPTSLSTERPSSTGRARTGHGWLREPLLHFVVLGALLFALDHFIVGRADDPRTIVVDPAVDNDARQVFRNARGREPNEEELYALRRIWLDNEVLYREGLALGVDKGDSAIRERVIFKMLSLVDTDLKLPPYDDKLLNEWFEKNRQKYDEPARYDFQEAVLVGGPLRGGRARLRGHAEPRQGRGVECGTARVQGPPPFQHRPGIRRRVREDARSLTDRPMARSCAHAMAGARCSSNAISPPKPAVYEAVRGVVLQDWTDATMAEKRTAAVRALAKKYTVKYEAGPK